ncbi:hypothetical protein FSS13T_00990 [Flavobacterium saliperosum S13]|uniref:Outer membrane protein beta-barrel domain-containing protein n=2 Tax=Flavobacterium saliperosum TaxID=329186 RepID=A0A1G4V2F4_9FLAO|nr:porin family protein [Flavobacterium saliperosum]ESU27631.1 hypothetical protein FSS13T_00990 [Flavobacterium saliperosum S13]SCX00139.1 Outer membrane protein beta-barrel domain-containing protein [Flavobacterium saliperosum]
MKKKMIFVFLLFSLCFYAQSDDTATPSKFSFGVSGGVNFSNLLQSDGGNQNSITGFHFMGFGEYRFSDKLSIQPGVAYSRQGAETDEMYDAESNTTTKFKIALDYVNVPILLKYYVVKGFGVEAGPQIGFLTTAKAKDIFVDGESSDIDVDIKDMFKSVDFGIDVGVFYDFQQGFLVGGRYNYGVSDIAEDNPGDPITNSVFQLYLGFKY